MRRGATLHLLLFGLAVSGCGRYEFGFADAGPVDSGGFDGGGVSAFDAGAALDGGPFDSGGIDSGGFDSGPVAQADSGPQDAAVDANLGDAGCDTPCSFGDPCKLGRVDCSSGTPTCVEAGPAPINTVCRPSQGECDITEKCDGVSTSCPADQNDVGRLCGEASDACSLVCNATDADCPAHAAPCNTHLSFDGDDRVTIPDDGTLGIQTFTVEAFVFLPSSAPENTDLPVFGSGPSDNRAGVYFRREGSDVRGCYFHSSGGGCRAPLPGLLDRWMHVAMLVTAGDPDVYVDGTRLLNGGTPMTMSSADARWGSEPSGNGFVGQISMGRFWSRVLTDGELATLADGRQPTDRTGLLSEWGFEEGSGQSAGDAVGSLDSTLGASSLTETSDPAWVP